MQHANTRVLTVFALAALAATAQADDEPKNLLFFGNSFTGSGGGVHTLVRDVATAAGHPTPHVFGMVVGGQTLEWHLASTASVITSGIPAGQHWDAVMLQEYSTRPTTHPTDANVPAFIDAARGLYQATLNHSPNAQSVLFETWARGPGHSFYPSIWNEPAEMQAELRANYDLCRDQLALLGPSEVAPIGDAFELGGFDLSLYASDIYHASNKGALLISLVMYGTIYDDRTTGDFDLTDVQTRLGLTQADVDAATQLADAVLAPAPSTLSALALFGLAARRRR